MLYLDYSAKAMKKGGKTPAYRLVPKLRATKSSAAVFAGGGEYEGDMNEPTWGRGGTQSLRFWHRTIFERPAERPRQNTGAIFEQEGNKENGGCTPAP